jgi:hypothetical protein
MKKAWMSLDLKHSYPAEATVPELFGEAAASFPDKVALCGGETS